MKKIWNIKKHKKPVKALVKSLNEAFGSGFCDTNPILTQLLIDRGIDSASKIKNFLNPLEAKLISPYMFSDMEKSVMRIDSAIKKGENIVIYGDFDADGATSTALLYKTLKFLGANVSYYIPNRKNEGHGLNSAALVKIMTKHKAKLVITVDCGISDVEQIRFARGFKLDVIITDHHEAPEILPDAFSIINPKAPGALSSELNVEQIESLNYLAGVGVAFKLACALLEFYKKPEFTQELLPLVAVGTIADMVPLLGENRTLAALGMDLIEKGKNPGLSALFKSAGNDLKNGVTSDDIGFCVAPRINAAGRLSTVDAALELLVSDNSKKIENAVAELNNLNKIRQDMCDKTFAEALEMLGNENTNPAIILFNKDWHIGIIGIVASKLLESFNKPVFLMSQDDKGLIRCSSRGVKGLDLYSIISEHAGVLSGFGGHKSAAGLFFDLKNISIEDLKSRLNASVEQALQGLDLSPVLDIDMEIESSQLNFQLISQIEKMQPFGVKNPAPVFVLTDLIFKQKKIMAEKHLKFFCEDTHSNILECVWWSHTQLDIEAGSKLDAAFYPKINRFNGNTTLQLEVRDVKFETKIQNEPEVRTLGGVEGFQSKNPYIHSKAAGCRVESPPRMKIYDHRRKTDIYNQVSDFVENFGQKIIIFAENKSVINTLAAHDALSSKVTNRLNVAKAQHLMFFDYPPCESVLNKIIEDAQPSNIHFMNYCLPLIQPDELIKQLSGMLKFAHNNKDGYLNIQEIAQILALSDKLITNAMRMFESVAMIEIDALTDVDLRIKFLRSAKMSEFIQNPYYEAIELEIENIKKFRHKLLHGETLKL